MYLRSFRHPRAAVKPPSGAATIESRRTSWAPPSSIAMAAVQERDGLRAPCVCARRRWIVRIPALSNGTADLSPREPLVRRNVAPGRNGQSDVLYRAGRQARHTPHLARVVRGPSEARVVSELVVSRGCLLRTARGAYRPSRTV